MFFDSHAHYDDEKFDIDREEILQSIFDNEITRITNIGANIETSKKSVELANKYDFIFAAVGVHPHDVEDICDDDMNLLKELSKNKKVVAIGEIGLDYYYDNSPRELQKKWFKKQLNLANELDLPVVVHTRDAIEDTLNILKSNPVKSCVIHCFSQSLEIAKIILDLGYYISFAGPVTFKNAKGIIDVVKYVPNDRFLIETDCPYLTPEPNRGKRNNSIFMKDTAQKIAEIRNTTVDNIAKLTFDNATKLYRI